jgi:MFS superfamily sulfate permease-like transporter
MEALIALAVFIILTAVVLIVIWRTLRRRYPRPPADTLDRIPPEKPREPDLQWWRYPIRAVIVAAVFFAVLGLVDGAGAAEADPQIPAALPAPDKKAVRIVLNTGDCPPQTDAALPILIFTVHIDPGNGKPQYSCARVMKRQYQPSPRAKMARASPTKE